jgi:hypothetical protein
MFFLLVLLTLCCYKKFKSPLTSICTDDGAAPYLQDLLNISPPDLKQGLPYLPVTHTHGGRPQRLSRVDLPRPQIRRRQQHLPLLLPGIYSPRGMIKPYDISSPGDIRTNTITVSIADSVVYQQALFCGTRGAYPGTVQYLDSVLASLEPTLTSPLA